MATVDDRAVADRQQQRAALEQRITDITRWQTALLRQAQDITDPDDPWATGPTRQGYNDPDTDKTKALAAVADLDAADAAEPARPTLVTSRSLSFPAARTPAFGSVILV